MFLRPIPTPRFGTAPTRRFSKRQFVVAVVATVFMAALGTHTVMAGRLPSVSLPARLLAPFTSSSAVAAAPADHPYAARAPPVLMLQDQRYAAYAASMRARAAPAARIAAAPALTQAERYASYAAARALAERAASVAPARVASVAPPRAGSAVRAF